MIKSAIVHNVITGTGKMKHEVVLFNEYDRRVDGTNGIVTKRTAVAFAKKQTPGICKAILEKIR